MSHPDMGIVGATTDTFILFENDVRRNRLVLPRIVEFGWKFGFGFLVGDVSRHKIVGRRINLPGIRSLTEVASARFSGICEVEAELH
jgi:hypothetical protein